MTLSVVADKEPPGGVLGRLFTRSSLPNEISIDENHREVVALCKKNFYSDGFSDGIGDFRSAMACFARFKTWIIIGLVSRPVWVFCLLG